MVVSRFQSGLSACGSALILWCEKFRNPNAVRLILLIRLFRPLMLLY